MNIVRPISDHGNAAAFPQHSLVRLVRDFATPEGVIPSGTTAMVLEVFDNGVAYLVEFDCDHDPPEFVRAEWLAAGEA